MAAAALLGVAVSLAGCGEQGQREPNASVAFDQRPAARAVGEAAGGRVLDLAGALTAGEEQRIAARLRNMPANLLIVLLKPEAGDSLERIGWAAGGGQKNVPLLVLIDPEGAQVRIEGDLAPERRAMVASAVREQLRSGRVVDAVLAGIDRLAQVVR